MSSSHAFVHVCCAVAAAIALAALGSCSGDVSAVTGICGNHIVEVGEDCDSFSAEGQEYACAPAEDADNACFYVCDFAGGSEAQACPSGWGCGRDGRCRRSTGLFAASPSLPARLSAQTLVAGDLDGDGFADIAGNQGSVITVRMGAEGGDFSSAFSIQVPEPSAPLFYGAVDGDGLMDVLVPLPVGFLGLRGQAARDFVPVGYSSFVVDLALGSLRLLPLQAFLGPDTPNGAADLGNEILGLAGVGMQFFEAATANPADYPRGYDGETLVRNFAVGDFDEDGVSDFVLAFADQSEMFFCRGNASSNEGSLQAVCNTDGPIDAPYPIDAMGTQVADINGDGLLDIMVAVRVPADAPVADGPGSLQVAVAEQIEPGIFNAIAVMRPEFAARAPTGGNGGGDDGDHGWPLAAGDFNGDGLSDYVFADAITTAEVEDPNLPVPEQTLIFRPVTQATGGRWRNSVIADLNGDRDLDVAVSLAGIGGVDVFLNVRVTAGGSNTLAFNKFHVDTDGAAQSLRTGDFDGDLVSDIALFESRDDGDRISVIFGNASGGPAPAVAMGTFGRIESMEPVVRDVGLSGFDFMTDLAVVTWTLDGRRRSANILQGDSSRRMLSPLFLLNGAGFDTAQGLLAGNFVQPEELRDVIVIGHNRADVGASRVWLLPGIGSEGAIGLPSTPPSSQLFADREQFDYACALWAAGDVDVDPFDELIAIDGRLGCPQPVQVGETRLIVQNIADIDFEGSMPLRTISLGSQWAGVRRLRVLDMDGDGARDIVAVFAGAESSIGDPGAAVVVLWNVGGDFSLEQATSIGFASGEFPSDAAAIDVDNDAVPELLVQTNSETNWRSLDAELRVYGESSAVDTGIPAEMAQPIPMEVADADADGLDDIVIAVEDELRVFLQRPDAPLGTQRRELESLEQVPEAQP